MQLKQRQSERLLCNDDLLEYCALLPEPYLPAMLRKVARVSGFVGPCQPSKAIRPPSGPYWIHEITHDGYRLMVRKDGSHPLLHPQRP